VRNPDLVAISPDGRYVAYAAEQAENQSLWVAQVAGGDDVEVVAPSKVVYGSLTFSSDGDFIYFVRGDPKDITLGSLYKMPTLGGMPQKLITGLDSPITLSPDSKQLAFVRNFDNGDSELIVAQNDGTGQKPIAIRRSPNKFLTAAWSPKGTAIATFASNVDGNVSYTKLYEVPAMRWVGTSAKQGALVCICGFTRLELAAKRSRNSHDREAGQLGRDSNLLHLLPRWRRVENH
jgi:Tol biopolymer transport system component